MIREAIRRALGIDPETPDPHGFNTGQKGMLFALNRDDPKSLGPHRNASIRHVYGGTVPETVVQDRRRKNRAARKARRINRRSA